MSEKLVSPSFKYLIFKLNYYLAGMKSIRLSEDSMHT